MKHLALPLAAALTACTAVHQAPDPSPAAPGTGDYVVVERPDPNTSEACRERRERVAAALGSAALVISSGPEVEGRFGADPHFFWLTGVNLPDIVLILEADDGALVRERLFLPAKDPGFERWNGTRLAPGAASEAATGIAETTELSTWKAAADELALQDRVVYTSGELASESLEGRPAEGLLRSAAAVRTPLELTSLQAAIDITQAALVDAFGVVAPGVFEFEAEAAIEGGFRKRGAFGPSFPSIIGSGPNSCFLHYRSNTRQMQAGELVVMDVGARYQGFAADVTRTIPVSGQFTPRQREVYQAVWDASVAGAAELRPGSSIRAAHRAAAAVLEERGFGDYFFHSVGHGLGLLVHDAPKSSAELEPGMVVTIEPGVYLSDESLGVRIENDWLITEDGARCLSTAVPSAPDELLDFLAKHRPGPALGDL